LILRENTAQSQIQSQDSHVTQANYPSENYEEANDDKAQSIDHRRQWSDWPPHN